MRLRNYLFILLGGLSVATSSCREEKNGGDDDGERGKNKTVHTYVAFNYDSISPDRQTFHCAGIWHNGEITKLSAGREDVYVYDVFISPSGDIYAAGNFDNVPLYWKNGVEYVLPDGRAATGVGELEGKVYCCGYNSTFQGDQAVMWIDGEPYNLKNGTRANSLYIGNNSSYIAGWGQRIVEGEIKEDAIVWINGQPMTALGQQNNTIDNTAEATDVVYYNTGFWVVGREKATAASYYPKVWIDYTHNNLEKPGMNTRLNAITCENGVFYIAGNDGLKAKYWKTTQKSKTERRPANVESFTLADLGTLQATVTDIAVLNGIVYCVGYTMNKDNTYNAKIWINNKDDKYGFPNSYSNVVPQAIAVVNQ